MYKLSDETVQLAQELDLQLHILATYGFNEFTVDYSVYDPDDYYFNQPGDCEGYETGLLGYELLWTERDRGQYTHGTYNLHKKGEANV